MTLRTLKERMLQTTLYEAGGLLVATPLYALVSGDELAGSLWLLATLSVAAMLWAPVWNMAFDALEWRVARRVASDRTARLRLIHAAGLEIGAVIVTLPILMTMGGLTLTQGLFANLGLTAVYVAWALVFHAAFDRLRPVRRELHAAFGR